MNEDQVTPDQYDRPVAYDAESRPLYAHPPVVPAQPAIVPISVSADIAKNEVSLETKLKHDTSKRYYPALNLLDEEYVISAIRRHPIGLFLPFSVGVILMALTLSVLSNYDLFVRIFNLTGSAAQVSVIALPLLLLNLLIAIGTYITYFVYTSNKFFLTNCNIIQDVQVGLFSHAEQMVSLGNIEDASYQQKGIFQQFFDYGSIRLSTEGNAKSYRFTYASHPKEHIDTLNNAIEAFKTSRPNNIDR